MESFSENSASGQSGPVGRKLSALCVCIDRKYENPAETARGKRRFFPHTQLHKRAFFRAGTFSGIDRERAFLQQEIHFLRLQEKVGNGFPEISERIARPACLRPSATGGYRYKRRRFSVRFQRPFVFFQSFQKGHGRVAQSLDPRRKRPAVPSAPPDKEKRSAPCTKKMNDFIRSFQKIFPGGRIIDPPSRKPHCFPPGTQSRAGNFLFPKRSLAKGNQLPINCRFC